MAVNEFGIDVTEETSTDTTKEIDVSAEIVAAEGNTTLKVTITKPAAALGSGSDITTVLNIDNAQQGIDPDTFFVEQLDDFEYYERDYIENNPGTVNNQFISYVGGYFSDTTGESTIGNRLIEVTSE